MTRQGKLLGLCVLALPLFAVLAGCHDSMTQNAQHDAQTEAAREQDCANPQWKAANLGLWYNICSGQQH
jgi:hypothetical protein